MKKLFYGLALCTMIVAPCITAEARQPEKVRRIGFLNPSGGPAANIEAFRQGLRGLGYIEGRNVAVDYRTGDSREHLAELATELVRQKVDVIVAVGPAAPAAKMATETVPIVLLTITQSVLYRADTVIR